MMITPMNNIPSLNVNEYFHFRKTELAYRKSPANKKRPIGELLFSSADQTLFPSFIF